jgi:hypothetical protein
MEKPMKKNVVQTEKKNEKECSRELQKLYHDMGILKSLLFLHEESKHQTNILFEQQLKKTLKNEEIISKHSEELRRLNVEIEELKSKLNISTPGEPCSEESKKKKKKKKKRTRYDKILNFKNILTFHIINL